MLEMFAIDKLSRYNVKTFAMFLFELKYNFLSVNKEFENLNATLSELEMRLR